VVKNHGTPHSNNRQIFNKSLQVPVKPQQQKATLGMDPAVQLDPKHAFSGVKHLETREPGD